MSKLKIHQRGFNLQEVQSKQDEMNNHLQFRQIFG